MQQVSLPDHEKGASWPAAEARSVGLRDAQIYRWRA
jgi:hypothetical protein